jgi:hypothetical protein
MFLRYKTYFFRVLKLIFKSLAFFKTRMKASSSTELHIYGEVLLFIHNRLFSPRLIFWSKKLQYEQIISGTHGKMYYFIILAPISKKK